MAGAGLLREALGELERQGRSDSAFERGLRRGLHVNGFRPHPGVYPLVVAGRLIAHLDIAFPPELVYLEADGIGWHSLPKAFRIDRVRGNEIVASTDWLSLHITRVEFERRPERFYRQLRQTLVRRRQSLG